MTDKTKILEILRESGESGIHSFDLVRQAGTFRAAARIDDLKREGFIINTKSEKKGNSYGVRYFLIENKPVYKYELTGNTAHKVLVNETKQEALF